MKQHTQRGFTIVEVTLAMAFLSILLLTVAFLTIHITSIYQKGLSIKAVTATGRELIDDFSRSLSSSAGIDADALCEGLSSSAVTKCKNDNGLKYIYQVRYAAADKINANLRRDNASNIPVSGVFCTGHYSYIWNSGYVLNKNANSTAKSYSAVLKANGNTYSNFRLLKIVDINRSVCSAQLDSNYTYSSSASSSNRTYNVSNIGTIEEILTSSEDNLALYSLDIFKPTTHDISHHSFYSGTFILATIQGGIDITAQGNYCSDAASLNLDTDFNYCAINKFNFAMRATGETKS